MSSFRSALLAVLALGAGAALAAETVVDDKYLETGGDGSNWPAYGRTSTEQRYSPLDQINADNVKKLGPQWVLELPKERSLIGTPLAVDGVLYFTGSYSRTRAWSNEQFDAAHDRLKARGLARLVGDALGKEGSARQGGEGLQDRRGGHGQTGIAVLGFGMQGHGGLSGMGQSSKAAWMLGLRWIGDCYFRKS